MKTLIYYACLSLIFFISPACEKTGDTNDPGEHNAISGKEKLLTGNEWKLTSYGRDINNNGLIDPSEESICDCNKDNFYSFIHGGTGLVKENADICPGRDSAGNFQWAFSNHESELELEDGMAVITKLDENCLVLTDKTPPPQKLILVYKH